MKRIVYFILIGLIALFAVVVVMWAWSKPGGVTVDLGTGTSVEMNFALAGAILLILSGIAALGLSFLGGVFALPGRLGRSRQRVRTRKANQALTDGLLAAEAGDATTALKLAKRALGHAEDERLKLLLEARAAEASDDWSSAERAWGQLARMPGGQLAGLRGSASAAAERGDAATAEARAKEALGLKTGADWPFQSLFDMQVARGDWEKALSTLGIGERRSLIEPEPARRRRAVLLTAQAAGTADDQRQAAQRALADAIRAAPGFPPAAWLGARHLMVDGKVKPAEQVLQLAWKARPHPALAQLARRLEPDAGPDTISKRLDAIAATNPSHRESRVLKAEVAIDRKDWVEAVKALALLVEEKPTARLCLLMERALRGYGDPAEADRWARMAATAAREPDWSDIDPRGGAFDYDPKDWSRLVYAFGDVGELIHARHERFSRELEAGRVPSLPAPEPSKADGASMPVKTPLAPPLDFVPDDD
ncbi:MAG: heme biosynthesis HemY N-terminal domain-containing protein [Pseudomonadota bacterium]